MENSLDFATYTQWSVYLTLAFFCLTLLAFILQWGFRFRLVGVTGFMGVLTVGLFGLGLGLFTHTTIPDAVRYTLVYDNGANQAVVAVQTPISKSEVEATLQQAANDLFSHGRIGGTDNKMTIRLRTVIHPQSGVTQPLYLGEARRSLISREDQQLEIEVFGKNLAKLPKASNS